MTTTFHTDTLQTVIDNFPLVQDHWNEIVKDSRKLDPHWDAFKRMEDAGVLRVFVARDSEDDSVVGYAVFAILPNLHDRNCTTATNDALFLRRDKRNGRVALRFFQYCATQLEAENIQGILWHSKPWLDFGPLLEKLGYTLIDRIYGKFN